MDLKRLSALARIVDVRYASNRFVVAIAAVAALGTAIFGFATGGEDPLLWAVRVGAGIFLAWAIARELDPDHATSAAVAGVVGGAAVALAAPELGAAAGFLVAVRIVARTTGMSAHPWELAALVGFAGYLAASPASWPAALALIWALWIDGGHTDAPHPPSRMAAIAAAACVVVVAIFTFPTGLSLDREWGTSIVFAVGIVAAWIAVNRLEVPTATGDHDRSPLSHGRLTQARVLAGAGLGLAALLTQIHPAAYAPLWTAIVGTALVSVVEREPAGAAG